MKKYSILFLFIIGLIGTSYSRVNHVIPMESEINPVEDSIFNKNIALEKNKEREWPKCLKPEGHLVSLGDDIFQLKILDVDTLGMFEIAIEGTDKIDNIKIEHGDDFKMYLVESLDSYNYKVRRICNKDLKSEWVNLELETLETRAAVVDFCDLDNTNIYENVKKVVNLEGNKSYIYFADNSIFDAYSDKYLDIVFNYYDNSPLVFNISNITIGEMFSNNSTKYLFEMLSYETNCSISIYIKNLPCSPNEFAICEQIVLYPSLSYGTLDSSEVISESSFGCDPSQICDITNNLAAEQDGSMMQLITEDLSNVDYEYLIYVLDIENIYIDLMGMPNMTTQTITLFDHLAPDYDIENWFWDINTFVGNTTINANIRYKLAGTAEVNCGMWVEIPLYASTILCPVFEGLNDHMDNTTLTFDYIDSSNPNYFNNLLQGLGLTEVQVNDSLQSSQISSINFNLSYTNENGVQSSNILYSSPITFQIASLSLVFDNVDLTGETTVVLTTEVSYNDGSESQCQQFYDIIPEVIDNSSNPPVSNCDPDNNTYEPLDSTMQLQSISVGDILYIRGFGFVVDEVAGAGTFFGTGRVSLPFNFEQPSQVLISFSGIKVNTSYNVYAGTVEVVQGTAAQYAEVFAPDTISIGGDICQDITPTEDYDTNFDVNGLNNRGFNENGIFEGNGTMFDDNGFDIYGNYKDGSEYDTNGCDVNGNDVNGNPCNIVQDSTVTAFIDSVLTDIDTTMNNLIDEAVLAYTDSLTQLNCQQYRATMDQKMTDLQLSPENQEYIIGTAGKYYNAGMSNYFLTEPQIPVLQTHDPTRDADIMAIEEAHVSLFHCDKLEIRLNDFLTISSNKDELIDLIKEDINNLSSHQVGEFQDPIKFSEWLQFRLEFHLKALLGDDYTDAGNMLHKESRNPIPYKSSNINLYPVTAALGDNPLDFYNNETGLAEEIFLFDQGFKEINGVSRAVYLEELERLMRLERMMGGGDSDVTLLKAPLKLPKLEVGLEYDIFIENIKITPTNATLDAYFIFREPIYHKKIIMHATNIQLGPGGLIGETQLFIENVIEIKLSNSVKMIINPTDDTFVSWDCNGFSGIGVDGQIEVCNNIIIPLDSQLQPMDPDERYRIDYTIQAQSWSDLYLELNADKPFAVVGYEKFQWKVADIIIDFSDLKSPTNDIEIPVGYESPHVSASANTIDNTWRGLYFGNVQVFLPKQFKKDTAALSIGVKTVMIDDNGVSGTLFAYNVMGLTEGNMGGWPFSIDSIELNFVANHLNGGSLKGDLKLPVSEDEIPYSASVYPGNYWEFKVTPPSEQRMELFLADVKLNENSSISIKYDEVEDDFSVKATLNGSLNISGDTTNVISIKDIKFTGMELSNKAPYFSAGNWGNINGVGLKYAGFGLNLTKIAPYNPGIGENGETRVGLGLDLNLSLVGDDLDIKAGGGINIEGVLEVDANGIQKWIFHDLYLTKFMVDAQFQSVERLHAELAFFKGDEVYGDGFWGSASCKIKSLCEAKAVALFGKIAKDTPAEYDYFMVDMLLSLSDATVPFIPPLVINGFGVGLSYHMFPNYENVDINAVLASSSGDNIPAFPNSFSGAEFTPNVNLGLGVKGTLLVETDKTPETFNGMVSLELLFNTNWSLKKIQLIGVGQLMTKLEISSMPTNPVNNPQTKPSGVDDSAKFSAYVNLRYNFQEEVFDGDLDIFLNAYGGKIKGSLNSGGKMVQANMHAGSDGWWLYVGTPEATNGNPGPCGLVMTSPINAELTAYFDIGTVIPNIGPIPSNVREIANSAAPSQSLRSSGRGFAFGASFETKANVDVFIASASLEADIGFDLMVRKFDNAHCAGEDSEIGFDGWYGMGQMWAFVQGELKILGKSVFKAGIAAILQAQLPNPFFAQATLAIKIKTWLGTIHKSASMEIGDVCLIVDENDDGTIKIITDILPQDGSTHVPVDTKPTVHLAIPLDEVIEMPTLSSGNVSFEAKLKEISMVSSKTGFDYGFNINISTKGTELEIVPSRFFLSEDTVTITAMVDVFKNNNYDYTDTTQVSIVMDEGYDIIPESNIAYTYPINGMNNYYKEEYNQNKGFIKLKQNQVELFYDIPEDKELLIRIISSQGEEHFVEFDFDIINAELTFPMEPSLFENEELYKLEVVSIEKGREDAISMNTGQGFNGMYDSPLAPAEDISDEADNMKTNVLYAMHFRVASHNTYFEKTGSCFDNVVSNDNEIKRNIPDNNHYYDKYELLGGENFNALVGFKFNPNIDSNTKSWYEANAQAYINVNKGEIEPYFPDAQLVDILATQTYDLEAAKYVGIKYKETDFIEVGASEFNAGFVSNSGNQAILFQTPIVFKKQIQDIVDAMQFDLASLKYISSQGDDLRKKSNKSESREQGDTYGSFEGFIGPYELMQIAPTINPTTGTMSGGIEYQELTPGTYKIITTYTLPNGVKTSEQKIPFIF